jgi:hypothetical protein
MPSRAAETERRSAGFGHDLSRETLMEMLKVDMPRQSGAKSGADLLRIPIGSG